MDAQILSTIISGIFSVGAAVGSVLLKDYLDRRRVQHAPSPAIAERPSEPATPSKTPSPSATARSATKPTQHTVSTLLIPISIVIGGALLGIAARLFRPYAGVDGVHYESLTAWAILIAICITLVVHNRKSHGLPGHLLYQLENLALWSGFTCGWSLVHGYFWGDLVTLSIAWWLGCSLLGSIILAVLQTRRRTKGAI